MKVFLIISGILALLIFIIAILPVRVELSYFDEFKYKLKIGFIEIIGSNKKPGKKKKNGKKKTAINKKETSDTIKKPSIDEIYSILIDFLRDFKWRLNIKVKYLDVYICCGDDDAAQTALLYGKMNAYAYSVDALLKSIVKICNSNISISVDYNSNKTLFEGKTNIFAPLGNILLAIIRLLVYLINNKEKLKPILDYIKNKDGVKNE